MFIIKHESECSKRELSQFRLTLHPLSSGKYYVIDSKGKAVGQYDDYEDAKDHADTLNGD